MIKKNLKIVKSERAEDLFSFVASTSDEDRYGDIIEQGPGAWDLDAYRSNPVVLFNHNSQAMPIGKGIVEAGENLEIDIQLDQGDPLGAELSRKLEAGFLHAVSVGFRALESVDRSKLPTEHKAAGSSGRYFQRSELLEVSIVTVPANGSATAMRSMSNEIQSEIKTLIRGELLSIPALQLRHVIDVTELEDRVVVSFSKFENQDEDPEISGIIENYQDHKDEEEDDQKEKDYNKYSNYNKFIIDTLSGLFSEQK